jgi:hypothetical protein
MEGKYSTNKGSEMKENFWLEIKTMSPLGRRTSRWTSRWTLTVTHEMSSLKRL